MRDGQTVNRCPLAHPAQVLALQSSLIDPLRKTPITRAQSLKNAYQEESSILLVPKVPGDQVNMLWHPSFLPLTFADPRGLGFNLS